MFTIDGKVISMIKTFKTKTRFAPAAITGTAATAFLLLVSCSDNTTETLTPPTTTVVEQPPETTVDVTRPSTPTSTTETDTTTTSTTADVAEDTPPTTTEPDTPVTTTTEPTKTLPSIDLFGDGFGVGLDGEIKPIKPPPRITTTTTTTPPTTTTTAPPPPKTDAEFRAIAAAGGIPYDENSPNGIHISYFWPDGIPEVGVIPDSALRDDLHLFGWGDIPLPEGANFTCDSLEPRYGGTLRELWEIILAGSHYQFTEPYHDCEWAAKLYELGCRKELAKLSDSEFWELYPSPRVFTPSDERFIDNTAEKEVYGQMLSAGVDSNLCDPGLGSNPE